jgi:aryl-alcohol dehydrogenase-like predicted oxidoreductase
MNHSPSAVGTTHRTLGPFRVPPIGLGCMNLSHAYGQPPDAAVAERLLLQAIDLGVTLFDTAALYGFGGNETLVGRVLKPHRDRIVLCSKGGMTGVMFDDGMRRVIDGRPEAVRRHCEDSLKRLGTDVIDLYYLHRWDKKVPIEDSVGACSDLLRAGKIRSIGLSEVSAATLLKAHAVHPIAALQSEYSPATRNPEIAVLKTCRELGTAFVAFSPVGRGLLTAEPPDVETLDAKDIRRTMPRFRPEAHAANLCLLDPFKVIADGAGCSTAQLALAWVLARGDHVLAIPGTTRPDHLRDNVGALQVRLDEATVGRIDELMTPQAVRGDRYSSVSQSEVDTEVF